MKLGVMGECEKEVDQVLERSKKVNIGEGLMRMRMGEIGKDRGMEGYEYG